MEVYELVKDIAQTFAFVSFGIFFIVLTIKALKNEDLD